MIRFVQEVLSGTSDSRILSSEENSTLTGARIFVSRMSEVFVNVWFRWVIASE